MSWSPALELELEEYITPRLNSITISALYTHFSRRGVSEEKLETWVKQNFVVSEGGGGMLALFNSAPPTKYDPVIKKPKKPDLRAILMKNKRDFDLARHKDPNKRTGSGAADGYPND